VRGALKLPSANVTSTNAAEFDAGSDDVFSLLAHRYWKSTMARQIAADRGSIVLDAAYSLMQILLSVFHRREHELASRTPYRRLFG
jgi:hypothetical protein